MKTHSSGRRKPRKAARNRVSEISVTVIGAKVKVIAEAGTKETKRYGCRDLSDLVIDLATTIAPGCAGDGRERLSVIVPVLNVETRAPLTWQFCLRLEV